MAPELLAHIPRESLAHPVSATTSAHRYQQHLVTTAMDAASFSFIMQEYRQVLVEIGPVTKDVVRH